LGDYSPKGIPEKGADRSIKSALFRYKYLLGLLTVSALASRGLK
jgi:hypothetical protein